MASRYFVGAVDDKWNNAGNWDAVSGGGGGAGVPTAADDVFFDASSPECHMDIDGVCLNFDQTGYASALHLESFKVTVSGTSVVLVAGGWEKGSATPELDLVATAGTVDLTSAANEINQVRVGNAGAGATYRLQDALTVTLNFNFVAGTVNTNNQALTVKQDLIWAAGLAADSFRAGSSVVTIHRHLQMESTNVMQTVAAFGTSQFRMVGTGTIKGTALLNRSVTFYDFHVAEAGQTTSKDIAGSSTITVQHRMTTGSGNFTNLTVSAGLQIGSTTYGCDDPLHPDPACNWDVAFTVNGDNTRTVQYIYPANYNITDATYGAVWRTPNGGGNHRWELAANVTLTVATYADISAATVTQDRAFSCAGFTLTVNGPLDSGMHTPTSYAYPVRFITGAGTVHCTGTMTLKNTTGNPYDPRLIDLKGGGTLRVGGFLLSAGNTSPWRVDMNGSCTIICSGNWDSSVTRLFYPMVGTDNILRFTAPGAFTMAFNAFDVLPEVEISGGGTSTLQDGFTCQYLTVINGTLTAAGDITVLNVYNGSVGGSLTVAGNFYVGAGIVNAGTLITAGSNIRTTGAIVTLSGVNPDDLTMSPYTIRLQLATGMDIGAFIIEDRDVPGVVVFKAGETFNVADLDSQVVPHDAPVQFLSDTAGAKYFFNVAALTGNANIWPMDCNASGGLALPGDTSNYDLGGNLNWTNLPTDAKVRVITDDPGEDELADGGFGTYQYCWLVADSLADLIVAAADFAAGARNWHRRTNIPLAILDNLYIGSTYYIALGLQDERGRRIAPDVGSDDYVAALADPLSGGGAVSIVNTPGNTYGG